MSKLNKKLSVSLKESVFLDAINGKLISHRSEDGNAKELCDKIATTYKTLLKNGKISSSKKDTNIISRNGCFLVSSPHGEEKVTEELPKEWGWLSQKEICWIDNGTKESKGSLPLLDARYLRNHSDPSFQESGVYVSSGEKLILVDGENSGEVFTTFCPGYMGSTFKKLRICEDMNEEYVLLVIKAKQKLYRGSKTGIAIPHLNKAVFRNGLIKIPPMNEQKRICDRVNQLLPLLTSLEGFEEQYQKLNDTFVPAVKKSILLAAFSGQLVKHIGTKDDSESILIDAKDEKAVLQKRGMIKKDDEDLTINMDDSKKYGMLPANWTICKLSDVCLTIRRGKSPKYVESSEYPALAQKCNQWDGISLEKALFLNPDSISKYGWEQILKVDDVVMNSTGGGTVGRTNIVDGGIFSKFPFVYPDSHITIVRPASSVNPKFIYYFVINPIIQDNIEGRCTGSTNQMELYSSTIKSLYLPLPPILEQNAIVAKIENCFRVLDEYGTKTI